MDDLLSDFLTETNECLADLDSALVKLEKTPDDAETLGLIFRMVHTIKGTCGFLGLPRLERVAHAGENILGKLRDKTLAATPDIVTQVLAAIDRIKLIVAGLAETGVETAGDDAPLIAALNAVASGEPVAASPAAAESAPEAEPDEAAAGAIPDPMEAAAPGSDLPSEAAAPAPPEIEDPVTASEPRPTVIADAPKDAVAAPPPVQPVREPNEPVAAGPPQAAAQTIRVTVDVLEDLMTLVSELVLTRNQLLQLARNQDNGAFTVPLQRLSHITSELQEGVMKTRMQPIGNAWNKLPRLVRDLCHDLGKKITLTMLGADTELDRQVLEQIKDPLTHMIRNSGDHGLETPAERRAAGKAETGHITLNAFHEGGHILLEVSDDGRGLPVDRIRAKALANGLATEAELAAMSEDQILRFIFAAGFSTAVTVSAVSGRGVGLDVVKTNIEKIGGTIDLKSTPGKGTMFTIKIPLTLAIVSALIVEACGERFAIPQISVVELVRAKHEAEKAANAGTESVIERINDTPVLRLRNRLLPLVSLTELLELGTRQATDGGADVVVAQVGSQMMGIIVDRVFDTEEIVVKPVAPILRHVTMFSGNTILGDGSVIMILDPNGIARRAGVGFGSKSRHEQSSRVEAKATSDQTAMLLFHAGGSQRMAVPLGLVARLEDIPRETIEMSCGSPVTQYRGKLMPLISMGGDDPNSDKPTQPLLVFAEGGRTMGLMVDEIVDVVDDRLEIELAGARPGLLGSAVIGGHATDVLDTGYWLMQAWEDWFRGAPRQGDSVGQKHILLVDDSDFFRQLIVPTLNAAGLRVTAVSSAAEALRLRENSNMYDAIVSDIEMPDMDGLQFARAIRAGGIWAELPLIAMTGHTDPQYAQAGHQAGFTDYITKFEREALVASLRSNLAETVAA